MIQYTCTQNYMLFIKENQKGNNMTKKELSDKIKYIEREYFLTLGIYQLRQLNELFETLSIRHPQYCQLEGFIGFVNSRLQANEELKSYLHSLTPSKDVLDEIYSAVECKFYIDLKESFVRGAEDFLDTISWRHPQYESLEKAIEFVCKQEEQQIDLLNYLEGEINDYC